MYENRIVAFIDILNFKNKIKATEDKDEAKAALQLNRLIYVLEYIQKEFSKAVDNNQTTFQATMFSDSVVFSVKEHNGLDFIAIAELLKKLQVNLIKEDILLRGGIVFGKIIHDDKKIIGPALIDAYELEGKSALYPRIVIDPDILEIKAGGNEFSDGLFNIEDFDNKKILQQDFDGTYYVEYFSDADKYLDQPNSKEHYATLRKLIRAGVNNPNIGIRIKYLWMLHKFNKYKPADIAPMACKIANASLDFDSWSMYALGGNIKNMASVKEAINYFGAYFRRNSVKQFSGGVADDFTFKFQLLMQRSELYQNLLQEIKHDSNVQLQGYTAI
jgi:hypothetical protein